eukprot:CAMPEP_0185747454 /NCGR_PEP_ID=MMETSP1174-20130828/6066_1 /TAXON_ID=35687 /ORGANISM="Dictyocha speculum, Strain CCMP1381" /LENGTH=35 /DNA_ID= /DNA_START= /DNA_END= /DNA_ORIENTATION=
MGSCGRAIAAASGWTLVRRDRANKDIGDLQFFLAR